MDILRKEYCTRRGSALEAFRTRAKSRTGRVSAGEIVVAVENYAAEMGYTKAEAQEIRSGLNPKMITRAVASIQGRTVVRKVSKHLPTLLHTHHSRASYFHR